MATKKKLRICTEGHRYYKSSDCPTCPKCEAAKRPKQGFMALLSAPAQRALENNGITTLKKLSKYSSKELLQLHGLGKSTLPILKDLLAKNGLGLND